MLKEKVKHLTNFFKRVFLKEILVLGDSHVLVFDSKYLKSKYKGLFFNICSVGGATVSGLENPNSQTQAMPIFMNSLRSSRPKLIIINLGEVDTGFVIWYKNQFSSVSIDVALISAVNNYKALLDKASKVAEVICISAPLPTIRDDQCWGEVANLRKEVKANQLERTKLTVRFNELVEEYCRSKSYKYINLDKYSINSAGVVKNSLLNNDINNHHYDDKAYSEMLLKHLVF